MYTKKIPAVGHMNYWERLRSLRIYSQQRRLERYRIIYTWKILEGLVPNCGLILVENSRRGRLVEIPPLKGKPSVRKLREQSFQVDGPKLFNSLPKYLRDLTKVPVEELKEQLDKFLETIPDQPCIGGLTTAACDLFTAMPSNSVIDQIRCIQHGKFGA